MADRRCTQLVEERAALILASQFSVHAYMVQFEAQMRRGTIRRLLYAVYLHLAVSGAILADLDVQAIDLNAGDIW